MIAKYLKTAQYAKLYNMNRRTVINNFHKGFIPGYQDKNTKTIYILNPEYQEQKPKTVKRAILYARVSSSTNKKSLDGQISRMEEYCSVKGYQIVDEVKEIASGMNANRRKLSRILKRDDYDILLCEHPDRLTRFGFNYLVILLGRLHVTVEPINVAKTKDEDLFNDFVSIVTSFCQRLYGRNRKKKTMAIIDALKTKQEKKENEK